MTAYYLKQRLKRNIPVNYLFTFLFYTDLTRGIWMIYLAGRGFSLIQLGLLESAFHVTSFLMEVPTGAIADLWGRKASRLLSRVLFLGSLALMFYSTEFIFQVLGFVICALNYDLESGAGEALVYDSLKQLDRESDFMKVKGRQEFLIQVAAIAAFLLGGWLAVINYALNFGLAALFAVLTILAGLFFQEPPIPRDTAPGTGWLPRRILHSTWNQTMGGLRVVRERPRIAFFILFSEMTFVFATTSFFYLQNYWKTLGRTEFYIGVIFALQCAVSGITGLFAPRLERILGEKGILISVPILMAVCQWGIALSSVPGLFFVMVGLLEGVLAVAVSTYINRLIPSEYRATILSYQSMVFSFFMILLFPVVGYFGEKFGLKSGFLFMAWVASVGVSCFLLMQMVLKHRRVQSGE
jgi:MFS family permease